MNTLTTYTSSAYEEEERIKPPLAKEQCSKALSLSEKTPNKNSYCVYTDRERGSDPRPIEIDRRARCMCDDGKRIKICLGGGTWGWREGTTIIPRFANAWPGGAS